MAQIIIVIINTRSIIIRMVRMNCGHVSPTDGAVWCDGTPPLSLTFLLTSFFFSYIYIFSQISSPIGICVGGDKKHYK